MPLLDPVTMATIRGQVLQAGSSNFVPTALVRLMTINGRGVVQQAFGQNGGRYEFSVPPGRYLLVAMHYWGAYKPAGYLCEVTEGGELEVNPELEPVNGPQAGDSPEDVTRKAGSEALGAALPVPYLNGDGTIDLEDLLILQQHWHRPVD